MSEETIVLSQEYSDASSNFRNAWQRGIEAAQEATIAMTNMMNSLIGKGYQKSEAIKQIIDDH